MTIVITTLLDVTDQGTTVWDSTSEGNGFVVEFTDPPLTAGTPVVRAEDHTTYVDNSNSVKTADPATSIPRVSTLLSSVTVDIDHNDNGIIKTVDSHADGFSDFTSEETRFDADGDTVFAENERQTVVSLVTHDFSEYHETDGFTDFLTDVGSVETAAGTTPEGLTQTLQSNSSYVDDGDFAFTLDTTSTIDFTLDDTDLTGGSLPAPDPNAEDPDEVVILTLTATLLSVTSLGHSDITASELVDFDETDESQHPAILGRILRPGRAAAEGMASAGARLPDRRPERPRDAEGDTGILRRAGRNAGPFD